MTDCDPDMINGTTQRKADEQRRQRNATITTVAQLGAAAFTAMAILAAAFTYSASQSAAATPIPQVPNSSAVSATAVSFLPTEAKPEKLPKKRTWVRAKFTAAGNALGVDGSKVKVGVGVLPKIVFSKPIPDKLVVEENLIVSAQLPSGEVVPVEGAWGWLNETSAVFRPKAYWPGNSTITIVSSLGRTVLGRSGSKSLIGSAKLNTTYTFQTDRKLIARVNGKTKTMKVYVDGEKVKTFKVSLGKKGWETRNGTKVISTSKEATKTYRSESLGLTDEQYALFAPWNTRLTPTGEFLHAAPWAYDRLGIHNGSHGCTNMFADDAKWIFKQTIPGDVVFFKNTGGNVNEPGNGPGGLWNIPWNKWLKKSASSHLSLSPPSLQWEL
mgnify:FL=1